MMQTNLTRLPYVVVLLLAAITTLHARFSYGPTNNARPSWRLTAASSSPRNSSPNDDAKEQSAASRKMLSLRGGAGLDLGQLDWRYFVAGGLCAAWSHGITTPLDVIKTRMQAFPERYTNGVAAAAVDIIRTEGLSFLLAGLGPTVVGYGLEGALKFGFYETCKKLFSGLTPSTFANFLLASVVAGAIASIVLCPMEEARIKMVKDPSWTNENVVSGLIRLVREDGLFASFGSLAAMLSKQVPYTMGKQVSFDFITGCLYSLAASAALSKDDLKWPISIASAFLASIVACLSSQPGDTILTLTYKSDEATTTAAGGEKKSPQSGSRSFGRVVSGIYRDYGLGGFYLGTQARLAHVGAIITSQLVVYDVVKMALGLPVTGSH